MATMQQNLEIFLEDAALAKGVFSLEWLARQIAKPMTEAPQIEKDLAEHVLELLRVRECAEVLAVASRMPAASISFREYDGSIEFFLARPANANFTSDRETMFHLTLSPIDSTGKEFKVSELQRDECLDYEGLVKEGVLEKVPFIKGHMVRTEINIDSQEYGMSMPDITCEVQKGRAENFGERYNGRIQCALGWMLPEIGDIFRRQLSGALCLRQQVCVTKNPLRAREVSKPFQTAVEAGDIVRFLSGDIIEKRSLLAQALSNSSPLGGLQNTLFTAQKLGIFG